MVKHFSIFFELNLNFSYWLTVLRGGKVTSRSQFGTQIWVESCGVMWCSVCALRVELRSTYNIKTEAQNEIGILIKYGMIY